MLLTLKSLGMKKYLLLIFLLLGCSSGDNTSETGDVPVINLSDKVSEVSSLPLSEAAVTLEVIPLEVTDEALLSGINHLRVTDHDIWVSINKSQYIYRFSRTGKYLGKVGKIGQGPQEYIRMSDFIIDDERQEVYIITTVNGIKVYDFEGNYKRDATKQKLFMDEEFSANNCKLIFHHQSFFLSQNLCVIKPIDNPKDSLWSIALVDSAFSKEKIFKNPVHIGREEQIVEHRGKPEQYDMVNYWCEYDNCFDMYGGELTLKYADTDTIYQYDVEEREFIPQYSIFTREEKGEYETTHLFVKDKKDFNCFSIRSYFSCRDFIYLIGSKGKEVYTFCYDKRDGSVRKEVRESEFGEYDSSWWIKWFSKPYLYLSCPFVLENDFVGGDFTVDYRSCGKYWIDVLEPGSKDNWIDVKQIKASTSCDENRKQDFVKVLENVDEDSNPILMIATLK